MKLDIGGVRFKTTRQTLTSQPQTFFEGLLSGRFEVLEDDGYIFIDRDGRLFEPILRFLRTGQVCLLI